MRKIDFEHGGICFFRLGFGLEGRELEPKWDLESWINYVAGSGNRL